MMTIKIKLDTLIARKMLAEDRHITIREVSENTEVSENRLIDYRKDRARAIKLETIAAFCDYFECEPGDIFGRVVDN